ncbi:hypothetical protein [Massilia sp. S19_KUP03_FR1]|uniref:hypothetical protein n=1 Tax=Massilia sp. S19_KUP03_FR1 TaxID=3025503 RepID=UPI002FCCF993
MSTILCMLAGLSGCGGADQTALQADHTARMPSADCEPQACQGLRIIDSNAETFRADSARRDALAAAVAQLNDAAPVH